METLMDLEVGAPAPVRSVLELIGNTPMIELRRFAPEGRAAIFAKLEWFTPGGSVKDRTGLGMVLWAEEQGLLQKGGTLVEPTAGNTGIGIALVGAQRGYQVVLVVPEKYAIEKVKLMEALGGRVVRTPTADGIQGAIAKAKEIAAEIPGAFVPQQFENPGNPRIHELTTGPEIWQQMEGKIDAAVIGVGSGGTFTGVARYLKARLPKVLCVAVETNGSVLQGGEPGPHEVEGIGTSFLPDVLDRGLMEEVIMVHDDDCFATAKQLARDEGLLVGGSSGGNCNAALQIARRLGPGKRVVTVFPDTAERYLSKGRLGGA
jgi:cysteine synthase A